MHVPVLLHEVIRGLDLAVGATAVDATVGGGGYTKAMCDAVGPKGRVIGFDEDETALERGVEACGGSRCSFVPVLSNFRHMREKLTELGVEAIDGVAFDLGFSTFQLETAGRGFSFLRDEPLVMTFSSREGGRPFTAEAIVNGWSEETLSNILFGYGEERYSRQIAKAIVEARRKAPIATTAALADVVKSAVPARYRNGPLHPATKTFQALRIAVNDELAALSEGLAGAFESLRPGGKMAVVSFHSIEDRIVKNFFKDRVAEGATLLAKKPIAPTLQEMRTNPRSRSAKLRLIQRSLEGERGKR